VGVGNFDTSSIEGFFDSAVHFSADGPLHDGLGFKAKKENSTCK